MECYVVGGQEIGVGNGLLGIQISREEKALVTKSDPVVRVKESQRRGSLDWKRELGVVMEKAQAKGLVLGLFRGEEQREQWISNRIFGSQKRHKGSSIFQGLREQWTIDLRTPHRSLDITVDESAWYHDSSPGGCKRQEAQSCSQDQNKEKRI